MEGTGMERNVEVGLLFSIYRNMLTQRQAESIDLYYNEDLSLSESASIWELPGRECATISNGRNTRSLMWRRGWGLHSGF